MKKIFLLIVVPVLLVTLGFGQTAVPSSNADQASLKGCLGGSDGNYTVSEDGTTQVFKITSSTVDLKPHLGHDVEIIGQKANAATNSGSSDKSVIVTGVNMISEHCATATASTPAVADPTPAATASTPAVADPTPAATASTPAVADPTPAAAVSAPAVADPTPTAAVSTPAVADPTPAATASTPAVADPTPAATASTPAVADPTPAAAASTPAVADPTPTAAVSTPAVADPTPTAVATTPAVADPPTATPSATMTASATAPENTERMPDTASPLPLLGLLGFGLLTAGLLSRRLWANQR
jgi:hypothetical protein